MDSALRAVVAHVHRRAVHCPTYGVPMIRGTTRLIAHLGYPTEASRRR